jgi:hypothetical protein
MLEHGWSINKISTAVNMVEPEDPGYLVDGRGIMPELARSSYTLDLRTGPTDRSEVHGLRWEIIEYAAVLALQGHGGGLGTGMGDLH